MKNICNKTETIEYLSKFNEEYPLIIEKCVERNESECLKYDYINRIYSISSTYIEKGGYEALPNFVSINYDSNNIENANLSNWKIYANENNTNSSNCYISFNQSDNIFVKFSDFEEFFSINSERDNKCREELIKTDYNFEDAEKYYHSLIDDLSIKFDEVSNVKLNYELLYSSTPHNYIKSEYGISFNNNNSSDCNEIKMKDNEFLKYTYNLGVGVLINMIHTGYFRLLVYIYLLLIII